MLRFQPLAVTPLLWLAVILASELPGIVCREGLGIHERSFPWPEHVIWCQLIALIVLVGAAFAFSALRLARDPLLVLTALFIGWSVISPPLLENADYHRWARRTFGSGWLILVGRLILLPPAVLMTLVIVGRYGRRQLFLAWGRFSAPVRWSVLFPFPVRTWTTMLLIGLLLAIVLLGALLMQSIGFDWTRSTDLLPHLPSIIVAALFNAVAEEYVFRMVLLAVLIPVVGPRQAIAMTAMKFGLDHWYGQPSGPLGVLLMTYAGWAMAKSMVETDGAGWSLCLHTFGDAMIFSLLVLAELR